MSNADFSNISHIWDSSTGVLKSKYNFIQDETQKIAFRFILIEKYTSLILYQSQGCKMFMKVQ